MKLNENIEIHQTDFLDFKIDRKIDLVFADPMFNLNKEYASSNDYREDYYDWCKQWIKKCWGLLNDSGCFWLMTIQEHLGQKFSTMEEYGSFRNMVIWFNSSMPVKNRFCIGYQPLLWFVKDLKNYTFNYGVEKRVSQAALPWGRENKAGSIKDIWDDIPFISGGCMASKEAILQDGTKKKVHPAQMPLALAKRIVSYCTNPGDTVLDPFMGSGTVGVVCAQLDRKFIGIDISEQYFNLTKTRLENTIKD